MGDQPTSADRVFLARAFAHWCALHFGYSALEIEQSLDGLGDGRTRRCVDDACRLLGSLLARGHVDAWARPLGGGIPIRLEPQMWEIDDFSPRFASSAIALNKPFEPGAAPTHWLFLGVDRFNEVVEASCSDVFAREPAQTSSAATEPVIEPPREAIDARPERLLRMPEVERRTGLSRSTIYSRIAQKRFPASAPMGGNIAAWREADVDEWVRRPR